jgi:hypothetical protein
MNPLNGEIPAVELLFPIRNAGITLTISLAVFDIGFQTHPRHST